MYAVIATGGKQYKVTKGETLRVRDRKNHGAWSWQKGGNHQIPSP
jgi:hypothetical protein